jgi:hypothetical protein
MAGEAVSAGSEPASSGVLHPFTRALYERIDAQHVRVTLGDKVGVFGPDGRWIEGELREADPQLCGWLGGPRMVHHRLLVPEPRA